MEYLDLLSANVAKLSERDRVFAQSLLDQARTRGLSSKQAEWVRKLALRTEAKVAPKCDGLAPIVALLTKASQTLKYPKIALQAGDLELRLSLASARSRNPGAVHVTSTDKAFEERAYYGRIGADGCFVAGRDLEPATQTAIGAALRAIADDPAAAAQAYGKRTGHCCFCCRPLTDARSVHVGYGPVCAEKYGLPWDAGA
jgi:hypothetical protein